MSAPRPRTHDDTARLEPALVTSDVANVLRVHPSHVGRLCEREGLPCFLVSVGPSGRKSRRFLLEEVRDWIESRRERQIMALIDGNRGRRRTAGGGS